MSYSGPYQVTEQDRQQRATLRKSDIGKWYILINGAMQFVKDEYHGRGLIQLLRQDEREHHQAYKTSQYRDYDNSPRNYYGPPNSE